jgi:hypothetical protein
MLSVGVGSVSCASAAMPELKAIAMATKQTVGSVCQLSCKIAMAMDRRIVLIALLT